MNRLRRLLTNWLAGGDLRCVKVERQRLRFTSLQREVLFAAEDLAVALDGNTDHVVRPLRSTGQFLGRERANAAAAGGFVSGQEDLGVFRHVQRQCCGGVV